MRPDTDTTTSRRAVPGGSARQRFVLIRHAESEADVLGEDDLLRGPLPHAGLTALGEVRARALARRLARHPLSPVAGTATRVYCSPQRSAARTGEVLAAELRSPLVRDSRLGDVRTPARFPWPISVRGWAAILEDRPRLPGHEVFGVESWVAQRARVRGFLEACGTPGRPEVFVVVSHTQTIRALLCELLGHGNRPPPSSDRLGIGDAGVLIVDRTGNRCGPPTTSGPKAWPVRRITAVT